MSLAVVKQEVLLCLCFLFLTEPPPSVFSLGLPGLSVSTRLNGRVVATLSEFTSCLSQFLVALSGQMVFSLPPCIVCSLLNSS